MVSLDVTLRPFTVLDEINGPNFITEAQHIADIERALRSYGVKMTRPLTDRYTAVDFRLSFGGKVSHRSRSALSGELTSCSDCVCADCARPTQVVTAVRGLYREQVSCLIVHAQRPKVPQYRVRFPLVCARLPCGSLDSSALISGVTQRVLRSRHSSGLGIVCAHARARNTSMGECG